MKVKSIDKMWKYVVFTYLLFWFMVLGIGGTAILVLNAPPLVTKWIVTLCSWAPTIALLVMFKKLKPKLTISGFYKNVFREKLRFNVFAAATFLIVGIFLLSAWLLSIYEGVAISMQLSFVLSALFGNILFTALQGASGEESGWRGYLMPEMEARYGFLKGNTILGLVWAFWHLPLWFVSASYTGIQLLIYIAVFIVGLTSFSIIIGVFMKQCNNLFLAFWMHFWFNFVLSFFIGKDLYLLTVYAFLYTLAAAFIVSIYLKKTEKKKHA